MITFEMRKPTETDGEVCVGVTGENLACTREFFIKGMTDDSLSYRIHLRFSDGSVNSVIPDSTEVTDEGTKLVWNIKENDIFAHGYFELQIEGSVSDGLVFQTQIVTLYADESLAIEDEEYANPNSETLKLRDEAEEMLAEVKSLQATLDQNLEDINKTGIADKESLSNKVSTDDSVTSDSYPSVDYLKAYYYTADAVDEKLSETDGKVTLLESSLSTTDEKVMSLESDLSTTDEKVAALESGLSAANEELAQKIECETGSGTLTPATSSYEGNEGNYQYVKVGNIVVLTVNITAINAGSNYFLMKGCPYACSTDANLAKSVTLTSKNSYCRVLVDKLWVGFMKMSGNFTDDETIIATVVYIT